MGGRWPANVILSPGMADALDAQTEGKLSVTGVYRKQEVGGDHKDGAVYGKFDRSYMSESRKNNAYANETGGASRFFLEAGYEQWELDWILANGLRPCGD